MFASGVWKDGWVVLSIALSFYPGSISTTVHWQSRVRYGRYSVNGFLHVRPAPHAQSCGSPRSRTALAASRPPASAAPWMEGSVRHTAVNHTRFLCFRLLLTVACLLVICFMRKPSLKPKRIGMQVGSLYVNRNHSA